MPEEKVALFLSSGFDVLNDLREYLAAIKRASPAKLTPKRQTC
jgi:hypothetical protein